MIADLISAHLPDQRHLRATLLKIVLNKNLRFTTMKKLIKLLIALIGINSAMAQWVPQNSGTTNDLKSVFFTDELTGYAVGNGGTILKTTNGGDNWEIKNSGTSEGLNSVFYVNENTGYTVGDNGTILKTTDAGENWTPKVSGTSSNLMAVHFPEENIGFSVSGSWTGPGIILKTTDGGENWTNSELSNNVILYAVYFINADTGIVVGKIGWMYPNGIIFKTTNGGTNWVNTYTCGVTYASLSSICFINTEQGFVVGLNNSGYLVRTADGGNGWTGNYINIAQGLSSCYFLNENIGYAVGWDYYNKSLILKTTNGGIEWTSQYNGSISNWYLTSVYFIDENIGYVVGDSGTILKTTNGGTTGINEREVIINSLVISPNPVKDKITISSPSITGNTQLSMFNVRGEKVLERQLSNNEIQIDISALPPGVYFVKLQNEKMVEVAKIIKE